MTKRVWYSSSSSPPPLNLFHLQQGLLCQNIIGYYDCEKKLVMVTDDLRNRVCLGKVGLYDIQ